MSEDARRQAYSSLMGAWKIRELRDLVAAGVTRSDPSFDTVMRTYIDAAEAAQVAMRRDLGASWPG